MDDQQLLTPDQVAERLQLSIYTILDYLRKGHPKGGKLRGFKSGKQWRIREGDLQTFIEEHLSNGDRPSAPHPVLVPSDPQRRKAHLVVQLRAWQAAGLSLQAMADRFNREGVPTISGRGRWLPGTIGNLLKQAEEAQP